MGLKIHTARKDHYCDLCHRKIPAGHRYWRDYEEDLLPGLVVKNEKQHTNCENYTKQEMDPDHD